MGLVVLVATAGLLLGQGTVAQSDGGAPAIAYGEARCANCQMFVREPDHAAAWVTDQGLGAFCDIGCLLIAVHRDHPDGVGVQATFVRDWLNGRWFEARNATFVQAEVWTPMRFGLFAFEDETVARRFAEENHGRTLTWAEATQHAVAAMMERHGHGGHHHGPHDGPHQGKHHGEPPEHSGAHPSGYQGGA